MFLGIAASKLPKEEAMKFTKQSFSLSKMGTIGIILLVLSGGYLITPYWTSLADYPLFMAKLVLVVILIVFIILLNIAAGKVKSGDEKSQLKKIQVMGQISLLTGIAILILAVLNFR
jgi:uncharacterized membrane protein